jgi:Holliday junction resolvase
MVNSKRKGSNFERELADYLNKFVEGGSFKRIATSGAIGTYLNEPALSADVTGKVSGLPKAIKIECKVGYGGEKYLSMQREWLNKIKIDAEKTNSLPLLVGKFTGAKKATGVQVFVAVELSDFVYILNQISLLDKEITKQIEKNGK